MNEKMNDLLEDVLKAYREKAMLVVGEYAQSAIDDQVQERKINRKIAAFRRRFTMIIKEGENR